MIWKVTGWPLRVYQMGGFLSGVMLGIYPNNIWTIIAIVYGFIGLFLFHTGRKIQWTVGYENWETWLHAEFLWQIIGVILGYIITRS